MTLISNTSRQFQAVLALSGAERFEHFVKVVADWQEAWGLFQDGWALASTDDVGVVFPLWPAKEYAEVCAVDQWQGYLPRSIALDDLMAILLPKLEADGVLPGIFFTPTGSGITISTDELRSALEAELAKY